MDSGEITMGMDAIWSLRKEELKVCELLHGQRLDSFEDFHSHVWFLVWDDSKTGLKWDYRPRNLCMASPCGLGFLTAWQPQGNLTFLYGGSEF